MALGARDLGGATMPARQGVLVTGLPRSGTSWVGKMLQAGGEVVYVNEPLNPEHPPGRSPGVLNAEVGHRFQYICADNDEEWAAAFADTLRLRYRPAAELRRNHSSLHDLGRLAKYCTAFTVGRIRGRRALLDDPYAVLSSAWFAERLGCQVVVCMRHPVSLVGSWHRLGWQVSLRELLDQPLLMRDLLGMYAGEMQALADSPDSIATTAMLWRVTYATVYDLLERLHPRLRLWRYEDLATDPVTKFRELYAECGLTWTDRAQQQVISATMGHGSTERSFEWSLRGGLSRTAFRPMDSRMALGSYRDRLSPDQIARVSELTADVARNFYGAKEGPS
jgi:hypothetical protein